MSPASNCATKYMKLEKNAIQYNKVSDPFSHSLHPHQLLATKHFEKEEEEKAEKIRQQIANKQQQFTFTNYDHVNFYDPNASGKHREFVQGREAVQHNEHQLQDQLRSMQEFRVGMDMYIWRMF